MLRPSSVSDGTPAYRAYARTAARLPHTARPIAQHRKRRITGQRIGEQRQLIVAADAAPAREANRARRVRRQPPDRARLRRRRRSRRAPRSSDPRQLIGKARWSHIGSTLSSRRVHRGRFDTAPALPRGRQLVVQPHLAVAPPERIGRRAATIKRLRPRACRRIAFNQLIEHIQPALLPALAFQSQPLLQLALSRTLKPSEIAAMQPGRVLSALRRRKGS